VAEQPVDICLLTETYYPVVGGGENQAKVLAGEFTRGGSKVCVLTRRTDAALKRHESIDGVCIDRLAPAGAGQLRKWGLVISALVALFCRRRSYDVILVCGFRVLGLPAVVAGRLLGKPCILKADTLGELSGEVFRSGLGRLGLHPHRRVVQTALRLRSQLLRRATAYVAISGPIADELAACGIDGDRIHRIPNSVDTGVFKPADEAEKRALREGLGIPPDALVVTFTGRLEATKGLSELLAAWRRIATMHPAAILLLVGSGGLGLHNCEADLRAYVAEHALNDKVRFTGSVDSVADYLRASDAFVFPSRREAFGVSVIEAMSCSLPVVATAAGGLADIVRDEENALVIPVDDADAMTDALDRVLRDRLPELGASGRDDVMQHYSSVAVIDSYRRLLEHCREESAAGTNER